MSQITFLRNVDADEFFESFLVSAIASILGIRAFLHLSGYPRLGGDALHVAHMLWGGLLMLIAVLLLLAFLGKQVKSVAAVLGGLGLGAFIDELGKFITHDNDYFYQPAVALMYVVFILIWIGMSWVRRRPLAEEERVGNALEITLEAVRRDLDRSERARAQDLLRTADPTDPVASALAAALASIERVAEPRPGPLNRLLAMVRAAYGRASRTAWFPRLVIAFFVVHSLNALIQTLRNVRLPLGSFFDWGELAFSLMPAVLVAWGAIRMVRGNHPAALQLFRTAVLILIFVTQFFAFYHDQFTAVIGLAANILVLATLRSMIHEEARIEQEAH